MFHFVNTYLLMCCSFPIMISILFHLNIPFLLFFYSFLPVIFFYCPFWIFPFSIKSHKQIPLFLNLWIAGDELLIKLFLKFHLRLKHYLHYRWMSVVRYPKPNEIRQLAKNNQRTCIIILKFISTFFAVQQCLEEVLLSYS